mmetsp:Transcript_31445/g.72943  ORF Transcript_31445/g.72943 Transcript_31445/m.72943 type:complete len:300 (-) Transcript_31445:769-1668(-)
MVPPCAGKHTVAHPGILAISVSAAPRRPRGKSERRVEDLKRSVAPVAPGCHLGTLTAASRLVHQRHPARVQKLTDAVGLGKVARAARFIPFIDQLQDLLLGWRIRPRFTPIPSLHNSLAAATLAASPAHSPVFPLAASGSLAGLCTRQHWHDAGRARARTCSRTGRIDQLVLREVNLQVGHWLVVLPAELPVILIHALQEFFHLVNCGFVALNAGARDTELQRFRALLLASTLKISRAHPPQPQLCLGLPDNALHVRALRANQPPRNLELLVILNANEEPACVLSGALHVHCPALSRRG